MFKKAPLAVFILKMSCVISQIDEDNILEKAYKMDSVKIVVFFKNKTTDTIAGSFIKERGETKNHIQSGERIIHADETDSIFVITRKSPETYKAISYKNLFLFNTLTGHIKAYSLSPTSNKYLSSYCQKDTGAIQGNPKDIKRELRKWVIDDPDTHKMYRKHLDNYFLKSFYKTMAISGTAFLVSAVFTNGEDGDSDISGATFGTALTACVFYFIYKHKHYLEIADKYNSSKRRKEVFFEN